MLSLLGLPALIAGLIITLAGTHWFAGAATVGWICIGVGAFFGVVLPLLILVRAAIGGVAWR